MDKIDIILWIISGGFTIIFGLIILLWNHMNSRFEKLEKRFENVDEDIKDIRKDMQEMRTSLNRMEGAFYSKECCMLKDEKHDRKAE